MESVLYNLHATLQELVPILGLTVLCVLLLGAIVSIGIGFVCWIISMIQGIGKD